MSSEAPRRTWSGFLVETASLGLLKGSTLAILAGRKKLAACSTLEERESLAVDIINDFARRSLLKMHNNPAWIEKKKADDAAAAAKAEEELAAARAEAAKAEAEAAALQAKADAIANGKAVASDLSDADAAKAEEIFNKHTTPTGLDLATFKTALIEICVVMTPPGGDHDIP